MSANLSTEIAQDPIGLDYAKFLPDSPGIVVELLNAPSIAAYGVVARATFAIWCAKTGMRAAIEDTAADKASPLRSSALALLDVLRGGVSDGIDFALPDNLAMLDAWLKAGALGQADHDNLLAIAATKISRAQQLGLPPVTEEQLRDAGIA